MKWMTIGILAAFFLSPLAFGQTVPQYGPCHEDVLNLCPDVQPGQGRILRCLNAHEANLTPACKARRAEIKEKIADFREACKDDIQKYCPRSRQNGEGNRRQCLNAHKSQLKPACREFFSSENKGLAPLNPGPGSAAPTKS